jgi:CubicO group peptidase (beta-lactamase class C family)
VKVPSRNGRDITLLDLATHRSGLPRQAGNMRAIEGRGAEERYAPELLYEFLSSIIAFRRDASGRVTALLLRTGGQERVAPKTR